MTGDVTGDVIGDADDADAAEEPDATGATAGDDAGGSENETENGADDEDGSAPLPDDTPFMREELPPGFWDDPEPPRDAPPPRAASAAPRARDDAPERATPPRRPARPAPQRGARVAAPQPAKILETAGEAGDPDAMLAVVQELFPGRVLRVEASPEEDGDLGATGSGAAPDGAEAPLEPDDD